ncbi:hypothetical protein K439DRAFT_1397185 [Ramaria rubella]|nr:hypothetical protein K439DRAFT_1397185 [Ramaria rubella]
MNTPLPVTTPDTHVVARRTSAVRYRSGHLESGRTAVLEDLGEIAILPISNLQALLPIVDIPYFTVPLTEIQERHSADGRWTCWPKDPVHTSGTEDAVFETLPQLFASIVECCKVAAPTPTTRLINNPKKASGSTRSNTSRPDGYFLRDPTMFAAEQGNPDEHTGDYWEDIAVPCEYKKTSQTQDCRDNERKVIWSMHHILRNDPCRRFTYGITVENTDLRLWLCHRAFTVVTASFNFITDQQALVTLVTSLALAGEASLGWDPTMRRRPGGVFDIDVLSCITGQTETFTTKKVLADFGAEAMQGRGTRVFEATDHNGATVVVKDCWRESDRAREGDIVRAIQERMQADPAIANQEDQGLFLSIICHGDVHIGGVADHTLDLIMHGTEVPNKCPSFKVTLPGDLPPEATLRPSKGSVGSIPLVTARVKTLMGERRAHPSEAPHRIHYRMVSAQLGEPVHKMRNLGAIFRVLKDITRALTYVHKYEYVHRDVSIGNVLCVAGRGVLTDLEYCKRTDDESTHDVRTGTREFMAVEVAAESYKFLGLDWEGAQPPFKHNALHDMESLWWIMTWALFNHGVRGAPSPYDLEAHRNACKHFFPEGTGADDRLAALAMPGTFKERTTTLPPSFQAPAKCAVTALAALSDRFKALEAGPHQFKTSVIEGIHEVFDNCFRNAGKCALPDDVVPLTDVSRSEERAAKKPRLGL